MQNKANRRDHRAKQSQFRTGNHGRSRQDRRCCRPGQLRETKPIWSRRAATGPSAVPNKANSTDPRRGPGDENAQNKPNWPEGVLRHRLDAPLRETKPICRRPREGAGGRGFMQNKANRRDHRAKQSQFRQSGRMGKCLVEKKLWRIEHAGDLGETKPISARTAMARGRQACWYCRRGRLYKQSQFATDGRGRPSSGSPAHSLRSGHALGDATRPHRTQLHTGAGQVENGCIRAVWRYHFGQ